MPQGTSKAGDNSFGISNEHGLIMRPTAHLSRIFRHLRHREGRGGNARGVLMAKPEPGSTPIYYHNSYESTQTR